METIARMLTSARSSIADQFDKARSGNRGRAGALYADRRLRESWFRPGIFYEPAWDLLLYLYDAHESGQLSVSITRATRACSAVSPESASRWIALLADNGYVAIEDSASPGARSLALTGAGVAAMSGYLQGVRSQPPETD